jgi:hypothetical protein
MSPVLGVVTLYQTSRPLASHDEVPSVVARIVAPLIGAPPSVSATAFAQVSFDGAWPLTRRWYGFQFVDVDEKCWTRITYGVPAVRATVAVARLRLVVPGQPSSLHEFAVGTTKFAEVAGVPVCTETIKSWFTLVMQLLMVQLPVVLGVK